MLKKFLLPAFLTLVSSGIFIMAITGQLDWTSSAAFVQGEIDGTRIDVSSKISARVLKNIGKDGAPVHQGDLLMMLDGSEMLPRVAQAEYSLAQSAAALEELRNGIRPEELRKLQAQYEGAKAVYLRAEQHHRRCIELYRDKSISKQDLEEAIKLLHQSRSQEELCRAALDEGIAGARKEKIAAAEAAVRMYEARLNEVKSLANDLTLRSPVTGEISKMLVKEGELVNAGYPLVTLIDLNDLWSVMLLREDQLQNIRMGQNIRGNIPALGKKDIVFSIDYIAPMGNYATWRATNNSASFDLKTFEVRAHPVLPTEGLRPGMSVIFPYPFQLAD